MKEKGFKGLLVWELAKNLAVKIYKFTDSGNLSRDYGLRDQMGRARAVLSGEF